MNALTPYKLQSLVAIVVFTLGLAAQAADIKCPDGQMASTTVTDGKVTTYCVADTCVEEVKEFQDLASKVKSLSTDTLERYRNCLDGTERAGKEDYVEGDDEGGDSDDDEDGKPDDCANFSVGCSALEDTDPKDLLDDANERNAKAQKELTETQQQARNDQKKFQNQMRTIERKQQQGARTYQLQLDAIQKKLDAAMKSADQELRKQVATLRAQITAKRNGLTEINDSVRAAENALAGAKSNWEASCRTEAYQKLEAIKTEIKKTNQEIKDKKIKTNFSSSNVAGASKRKEERERRKMQTDYANSYKECVAGMSGAGASAKNSLEAAKKALDSAQQSAVERRETLQQEIKDLMSDYADATTKNLEDKDTMRKGVESELAAAQVSYQNTIEDMNAAYQEAQENLSDAVQFGQQATAQAMQFANSSQMSLMAIQKRYQCSGGASTKSRSSAEKVRENWENAIQADDKRGTICAGLCSTNTKLVKMCADADKARVDNDKKASGKDSSK